MFVAASHFHSSLICASKAGAYPSRAITGLHSKGMPLALPTNIRLGQEANEREKHSSLIDYDRKKVLQYRPLEVENQIWL